MRSKKGTFMAGPMLDMVAYLVFIVIAVIFFAIFSLNSKPIENKIMSDINKDNTNILLLNILRTPVSLDGAESSIADMIIINRNKLADVSLKIGSVVALLCAEKDVKCNWAISIDYPDSNDYLFGQKEFIEPNNIEYFPGMSITEQALPYKNGVIKITFGFWRAVES